MMRVDVCPSDDDRTQDRLQAVLGVLGFVADDTWHDSGFGLGVSRYRLGVEEISVFKDAWMVDLCGSTELVNRILATLELSE